MSFCYFSYGSNMNSARMEARGLAFTRAESARLCGYRLVFNKRSHCTVGVAYANVVHSSQCAVEGVLYTLADPSALNIMDRFEGTPVRYSRECLAVQTAVGVKNAWIYLANPAYVEAGLLPESGYLAHLLAGAEFLSAEYMAMLRAQECRPSAQIQGLNGLLHNA
ncbi:MAG: gamma-glutamylcyclotransferase [Zhongshania sp.]|uniref:Gamma-glutamylcyclotransferase family protein n=1 Tax=Zhongshania guokunii TaxID=641783 RepID=A0ABV3U9Z8_9GAMM|nr:gamma-glutamylcyclotransferase family protein [Zhongshania sp.]MDF1691612.1 gamma-glutamylcyclotransferase [Zhongshania sp.]